MKKWQSAWLTSASALLLGIVLACSFAPFELFPFAILAPAAWLWLWMNQTPARAFWLGYWYGLGWFGAGVYWIYISIHLYGDVPPIGAGLVTLALFAFMALYPAYVAYFTNRYFAKNQTTQLLLAFPAIWVASEWLRSIILTGFPWLILGYSQTMSPLKGFAPILGVYGVSLATAMSSGLIVNAVLKFKQKNYSALYANLFLLITIWIAGAGLNLISWTNPTGKPLSVSLIQGNIPQELKWSPEHVQLSMDRYLSLTQSAWGKDKLIVWPEAAVPMSLQQAEDFIAQLDEQAKKHQSNLVIGIPIATEDGNSYYNAIVTLGKEKQVYLKRRLVPFGEYIPFARWFAHAFDLLNIPMANSIPGDRIQPPLQLGDYKILPSICYEIAFPELSNTQDSSIGILLTVTNDAWFGKSSAQAQHLQMAAMRAIELRRPLLFASNDGITAIIDSNGVVQTAIPAHTTQILTSQVQATTGTTPWMRFGMDPILIMLTCFLLFAKRAERVNKFATTKTSIKTI